MVCFHRRRGLWRSPHRRSELIHHSRFSAPWDTGLLADLLDGLQRGSCHQRRSRAGLHHRSCWACCCQHREGWTSHEEFISEIKKIWRYDLLVFVKDGRRSITTCWCGSIGAGWPGTIIAFWPPAAWATSGATSRASSGAASRTASSLSRDDGDGCKEDDNQEDLHLLAINVKLEMWVWGPYTGFKCQLMMIHRFLEFKGTNVWQKLERTFERMTMKSTKGWKQVWWQSKYTHLEYRLL